MLICCPCVLSIKEERDPGRRRELLELEEIFTIVLITKLLSLQYHRGALALIFFNKKQIVNMLYVLFQVKCVDSYMQSGFPTCF